MNGIKRRVSLSIEGWYYICVLGFVACGAVLRDINLLVVLAGLMIGPLLYNWRRVAFTLNQLKVIRHAPDQITAGDMLVVRLELKNEQRRQPASAVFVEDLLVRIAPNGTPRRITSRVLAAQIKAHETTSITYQQRLTRRGRYRFEWLRVSTGYPMGLVRGRVQWPRPAELIVYPKTGRMTANWLQMREPAASGGRRATVRRGANEGDFFGLRDWRPGDNKRWVHWRSTARRGRPVVKQFERRDWPELVLVVDLWQPAVATEEQIARIESAISLAASIVVDASRSGDDRITLAVAGKELDFLQGRGSAPLVSQSLELLSVVEPTTEDRLGEAIRRVQSAGDGTARATLITTRGASDQSLASDGTPMMDSFFANDNLLVINVGAGEEKLFCEGI